MPTPNAARKSVQDKFIAEWAGETIFDFDNDDFDVPEPAVEWVRLVIRTKVRKQTTLGRVGNRKFQSDAAVVAQVFVPVETGTSEADRLATKLANIYDGTRFDGLSFLAAETREIGESGGFHQYNVTCSFNYEDIK